MMGNLFLMLFQEKDTATALRTARQASLAGLVSKFTWPLGVHMAAWGGAYVYVCVCVCEGGTGRGGAEEYRDQTGSAGDRRC